MLRFLLLVTPALLLGLPAPATADAFYICQKKGHSQSWINAASLPGYKARGWRCKKRMEFGDRTPTAQKPTGRQRSGAGAQPRAATTIPRRFTGPAGERQTYEGYIQEAALRFKVPANLIRAVIRVESNFRPNAVSSAGAQGLMQLMPGTAKEMGVRDSFDPRQNILGGVRYLRILINRFAGDPKLTLAAYHAGPNIVASRGGIPYKQTERYVRSVLTHFLKYREARL